jgi:mono/diheme cytochrome c family protein
MLSRIARALTAAAITASLAGDPWNTGNPWNAPRPAASDVQPLNSASSLPSVAGVPSVASVPSVRWGVVPTPAAPPRGTTAVPAVTAKDISLRGNAAAGAHIVMMKCARCHGQDGSGGAEIVGLPPSRRPIPWNDRQAIGRLSDQELANRIAFGDREHDPDPAMHAFGRQLTAAQIGDIVAYIRDLAR